MKDIITKAAFLSSEQYAEKLEDLLITGACRVKPELKELIKSDVKKFYEIIAEKMSVVFQNKVNRYYFDNKHILTITDVDFIRRDGKTYFFFNYNEIQDTKQTS